LEDIMGYVLALILAGVLLGIEYAVAKWHERHERHGAAPRA
jgi:hypothetical protein